MRVPQKTRKDKGLALVNALVLVAALSAVAVLLLQLAQGARLRQAKTQEVIQAEAYLDGVELLVIGLLDADRKRGAVDHLGEAWAKAGATTGGSVPIDRGMARYDITDLQGKFSLSWIAGDDAPFGEAAFDQLIAAAGVSGGLGQAIREFARSGGPGNPQPYLQQIPPILPRGSLEILPQIQQVNGMTPADYARLEPLFTGVRTNGMINVNTAPRAVLQAVLPALSASEINALVETRRQEPFADEDALGTALLGMLGAEKAEDFDFGLYGVSSGWFRAKISVSLGQTRLARQVILERSGETGKTKAKFRFAQH